MKHAIVTGATGFAGRWLVRELLKKDIPVTAVVRPGSRRISLLPNHEKLNVVSCHINDYQSLPILVSKQEDSVFFHLAWEGVSGFERSNLQVQMENVMASKTAVIAAATMGCKAFVGAGSIMELETIAAVRTDGTTPGMPYIYGEAKHAAHTATKIEAANLGMRHVWAILTNLYGEYDDSPRFISATLGKILDHEPLEFTQGKQLYDFIHAEDAAQALICLAEKGRSCYSYVVGSGKPAPLRSFIETIGQLLAPDRELLFGSLPYTGVQLPKEILSTEALKQDTGFVPRIPFETGIQRTMAWMKEVRSA